MSEATPAVEFAALLRELKDRSGLSYGVLAKRLHMSTSTLHRYCNGDAVPTDYAPVERMARLCRAAPAELVELHRRWVLADATRGRRTEQATEVRAAEQEGQGSEAQGPEGHNGAAVAIGLAESSAADGAVPSESGPGPRPRRRTRTAVLAGAAVAAVLVGVVAVVGPPGGGTDGDGRREQVGAAGTGGTDGASASPTAGAPSASDSASPSGSPSTADQDASSPPASGPAARPGGRAAGDAVPVTVRTEPYAWESPCSQRYLIAAPPGKVHPPPVEQDATAWVAAEGAVSSGEQLVRLSVQGTGPETVVVEGIAVRVEGKRTPLAWNDYAMGYPGVGCGGNVPARSFTVALDAARPSLTPESGHRDFPFKVSESDPEVYYITADASAYDVSWYLELKWSSGSRSGTLVVNDKGRPFRTSGNNGRPAYEFPLGGDGWVPEGTTDLG
ncbi:helix-turn-helix transcriptional regulator [Streptomyces sp. SID14436]|uniref:Helix-turn-helix domain-containing protein n=3 Tax=unclassified Streptomyces TaxID=2593676 RepID=A0A6G3R1X9_9ACTN|nr:helix-turn-helix domain-containing protein [Streptomyces sp. SID14436]